MIKNADISDKPEDKRPADNMKLPPPKPQSGTQTRMPWAREDEQAPAKSSRKE